MASTARNHAILVVLAGLLLSAIVLAFIAGLRRGSDIERRNKYACAHARRPYPNVCCNVWAYVGISRSKAMPSRSNTLPSRSNAHGTPSTPPRCAQSAHIRWRTKRAPRALTRPAAEDSSTTRSVGDGCTGWIGMTASVVAIAGAEGIITICDIHRPTGAARIAGTTAFIARAPRGTEGTRVMRPGGTSASQRISYMTRNARTRRSTELSPADYVAEASTIRSIRTAASRWPRRT